MSKETLNDRVIQRIPLKQILEPKIAMRSKIKDDGLESLKASITTYGLLQPIVLRKVGKKFEIVAGHRRFTAHKELSLPTIEAICVESSDKDTLIMRLYENKHRENVSPYEESLYLHAMLDTLECKQKELADLIGVSTAYLSERLKITSYPPPVLAALRADEISFSVAREFSKVDDDKTIRSYLRYAKQGGINPTVAAKWRKQYEAERDASGVIEAPKVELGPAPVAPLQEVKIECQVCGEMVDSHEIVHVSSCRSCYNILKEEQ